MTVEGCSGLNVSTYFNKSEKKHDSYCKDREHPFHYDKPCSTSEGCVYDWESESCSLDTNSTLAGAYLNGGFGFGKLCLDREFTRLILMILFPPLYIILSEYERGFTNKSAILMNFILTSIFYVPGLIHALVYKDNR